MACQNCNGASEPCLAHLKSFQIEPLEYVKGLNENLCERYQLASDFSGTATADPTACSIGALAVAGTATKLVGKDSNGCIVETNLPTAPIAPTACSIGALISAGTATRDVGLDANGCLVHLPFAVGQVTVSADAGNVLTPGADGGAYLPCETIQDCVGQAILNGTGITYDDIMNAIGATTLCTQLEAMPHVALFPDGADVLWYDPITDTCSRSPLPVVAGFDPCNVTLDSQQFPLTMGEIATYQGYGIVTIDKESNCLKQNVPFNRIVADNLIFLDKNVLDTTQEFRGGNGIRTTISNVSAPVPDKPFDGWRVTFDVRLSTVLGNTLSFDGTGGLYASAGTVDACTLGAAITTAQPVALTDSWTLVTKDASGCLRVADAGLEIADQNGGSETIELGRLSSIQFDTVTPTPGSGIIPIATAITQPALGDIRVVQAFDNCELGKALPKVAVRNILPIGDLKGFVYTDGTDCVKAWEPPVTCNDNYEMMTHGIGWTPDEGWQFGRFTDRYAIRASSADNETWDFNRDRVLILNGTNPKTVTFPTRATSCDPLNFVIITNESVALTVNVPAGDNLIPISGAVASTQTFTPAVGKRGRVEIIYSGGGTDWHVFRSNND